MDGFEAIDGSLSALVASAGADARYPSEDVSSSGFSIWSSFVFDAAAGNRFRLIDLDPVNDGLAATVRGGNFTLAAWVLFDGDAASNLATGEGMTLLSFGSDALEPDSRFRVMYVQGGEESGGSGSAIRFDVGSYSGEQAVVVPHVPSSGSSSWAHVAVVASASAGEIRFSVDGGVLSDPIVWQGFSAEEATTTTGEHMVFGADETTNENGEGSFLGGRVRDIRLYARALSADELASDVYEAGGRVPMTLTLPPFSAFSWTDGFSAQSYTAPGEIETRIDYVVRRSEVDVASGSLSEGDGSATVEVSPFFYEDVSPYVEVVFTAAHLDPAGDGVVSEPLTLIAAAAD